MASAADRPGPSGGCSTGLVKDTEGFMSRHFERKISLAVSRRLAGDARHAQRDDARLGRDRARGRARSSCPRARPSRTAAPALPAPLDPRRLRRRARAAEVPGVALRRRARLLGRQRRPRPPSSPRSPSAGAARRAASGRSVLGAVGGRRHARFGRASSTARR